MGKAKRHIVVRFRETRGQWEADYRDHRGRHRPLFETEEEALAFAAEVAKTLHQDTPASPDMDTTLRAYAAQRLAAWRHQLAPRTLRSYTERLDNHVLPALGHMKVREIKRRHIKALLTEKQREGHAPNSIRLVRAALSTVLSDAMDDEIIAANPCLGLGRRRGVQPGKLTKADRQQKIRPMAREQRDALLAKASENHDRRHSVLFKVLAKGGLRPGETFALRPEDIDFRDKTLRVERALEKDRTVRPTKTYETRIVDLTPELAAALKRYLAWLKEQALRHGWGEPEWLFPNEAGRPLDEAGVRKVFKQTLERAGLPGFRLYDLRHTYASLLLAEGAPVTYVSEQMGHSSPATTFRFYARWIPSKGRRWADVLDSEAANLEPKSGTSGGQRLVSAGAGGGTRTHDLLITNQLLCH